MRQVCGFIRFPPPRKTDRHDTTGFFFSKKRFEYTKGINRSRKTKERQYNDKTKNKDTNNDIQNTTQKTKD